MKKGEKVKMKLDEIASRNGVEWGMGNIYLDFFKCLFIYLGRNFAQLALLQVNSLLYASNIMNLTILYI